LIGVLAVALVFSGCGEEGADPDRADPSPEAPAQAPAAGEAMTPGGSEPAISLEARIEDRDDGVSIRVTLEGLEPEARYPVHVHEGGCAESGRVSLPLGRVTGRPDGTGSVRMTVDGGRLPDRPFSVRVQDPTGATACTELGPAG
jgi:hypothetical protein